MFPRFQCCRGPPRLLSEVEQRQRRKLPAMPLTTKTQEFWPTFRGATDWMKKNQDVVETALNLLEIYPKLIQHKSCDRLWDFITKVAFFQKKDALLCKNTTACCANNKTNDKAKMVKDEHEVPEISVTDTKDSFIKTDRVYFCGHTADDEWQQLVLGLTSKFFVGCCEEKRSKSTALDKILNADSFIYVMDDKTITDPLYLEQLQIAHTWKIPVTFVREPSFLLPDPLPQSVFEITDRQVDYDTLHRPTSVTPPENLIKPYFQETRAQSVSQTESRIDTQHQKATVNLSTLKTCRSSSAYSQSSKQSSLSLNLPRISVSEPPTPALEMRKSLSDSFYLSQADYSNHRNDQDGGADSVLPRERSVTFSEFLTRGYDAAVLYHRLYHNDCLDRIVAVLKEESEPMDIVWNKFPDLVQTTKENMVLNSKIAAKPEVDSETLGQYSDLSKETINKEKRVSLESGTSAERRLSSEVETIYAIYSDSKDGPELVRWPFRGHREVSASPSLDSFGFQDVDLSLIVNIDLASSEEDS